MSAGIFNNKKDATDYLRGRVKAFGGAHPFVVAFDNKNTNTIESLVRDGVLTDAVFYSQSIDAFATLAIGGKESLATHGWVKILVAQVIALVKKR